jgi:hypothetical protein
VVTIVNLVQTKALQALALIGGCLVLLLPMAGLAVTTLLLPLIPTTGSAIPQFLQANLSFAPTQNREATAMSMSLNDFYPLLLFVALPVAILVAACLVKDAMSRRRVRNVGRDKWPHRRAMNAFRGWLYGTPATALHEGLPPRVEATAD